MTGVSDSVLHSLLDACDAAAVETMRAGRGGPFAASLHVAVDGVVQTIAGPVGNAVLETGLASAHAEDRLIQSENVALLRGILAQQSPENCEIFVISSGESCPACHAKLEVLARNLLQQKLILPGRFTVVYGASYEETAAVAGFKDSPYHEDFQRLPGTGLVKRNYLNLVALPDMLRTKMVDVVAPIALIATKDKVLAGTGDSPEIAAIQMASMMQKRVKIPEPWNLRGATLYTLTHDIGPVAYAECQWANVSTWISVDHPEAKLFATREAPDIPNARLFEIVARRANAPHPDSALTFRHLSPFANKAQHEWAKMPHPAHYNGV